MPYALIHYNKASERMTRSYLRLESKNGGKLKTFESEHPKPENLYKSCLWGVIILNKHISNLFKQVLICTLGLSGLSKL